MNFSVPDKFIENGGVEELLDMLELDAKSISKKILEELNS
jgi:deoxyxylulose-5-phosphate synthase